MGDIEWVKVYTTQGRLSAEMVRILLESFGIPALLSQESVGAIYGFTIGELGEVDILVQTSRINDAQEVLKAMEDGKLQQNGSTVENKEDTQDNLTKD